MLKKLLLFAAFAFLVQQANAQCVPNTSITVPGIYPDSATGLSPGVVNQPYNQVMQIKVPTDTVVVLFGGPQMITINSITLNSFTNLPPGVTYACYPANCIFPGGDNGCVLLSGTPTQVGVFNPIAITTTSATVTSIGTTITQIDTIDYYVITITQTQGLQNAQNKKFELFQNDPNPFSSYTNISFHCPVPMTVTLKVFNLLGKEVYHKSYISNTGRNSIKLEGDDFSPGVYMYSLSNGISTFTRRMVINKR